MTSSAVKSPTADELTSRAWLALRDTCAVHDGAVRTEHGSWCQACVDDLMELMERRYQAGRMHERNEAKWGAAVPVIDSAGDPPPMIDLEKAVRHAESERDAAKAETEMVTDSLGHRSNEVIELENRINKLMDMLAEIVADWDHFKMYTPKRAARMPR